MTPRIVTAAEAAQLIRMVRPSPCAGASPCWNRTRFSRGSRRGFSRRAVRET